MKVIDLIKELETYNSKAKLFGQEELEIEVENEFKTNNKKDFIKLIKKNYNEPEKLLNAEITKSNNIYFAAKWECYGYVSETEFFIKRI